MTAGAQQVTPVVPTGLTALPVSPTEIDLSWTDTPSETGFRLERSTDGVAFTPLMTLAASVTTYADTSVSGSAAYYYRVVGLYGTTESAASSVASSAPLQPPAAPANLAANPISPTRINLSWSDVAGETGYRIEQSIDGVNFLPIGTTLTGVTTYSDMTVSASSSYSYRVFATNAAGDSLASNVAQANTPALPTPPAAPDTLVATTVNYQRIDLSWADNSNNETGFIIERSTDGVNFSPLMTTAANATSYSDTSSMTLSTTYSYRVRATNAAGDSANSAIASAATPATLPVPAAASNLVATLVNYQRIDLSWTDNANNETGYKIERSTDGVNFTLLTTVAAGATSYSDTSALALATTYSYRVRATDSFGDSDNSNVSSATTPATPPAPAAANNLAATTISSSRIDLVWSDNATNETGYKIERSTDGVNYSVIATIAANSTNYSDTVGLSASTKYYYAVVATNAGGDSSLSNISSATTSTPTGLPAGFTSADIGPVGLSGSATYSNGTYTVQGAGADIYANSDAFQFVYQQMSGDGTIIARVASLTNVDANDKGGLMIRNSLASNAAEASVVVTPSNGIKFLRRTGAGGSTSSTTVNSLKAPYWLKLVRSGSTFTSYYSANGTSWTMIGSQSISMGTTVYVGLVVTAHKTTALATATFDNVSVG